MNFSIEKYLNNPSLDFKIKKIKLFVKNNLIY